MRFTLSILLVVLLPGSTFAAKQTMSLSQAHAAAEKGDAEADGDEHRAPVSLAIAGADESVGAQQDDDGRRIDDGEHVRQVANGDHGGVNPACPSRP